ncbi:hypothetical protein PM082_009536 [Marasmius tenuissimus]|nr:hypothetical protein PM082_009536 [Marasmius tenuissimus]
MEPRHSTIPGYIREIRLDLKPRTAFKYEDGILTGPIMQILMGLEDHPLNWEDSLDSCSLRSAISPSSR